VSLPGWWSHVRPVYEVYAAEIRRRDLDPEYGLPLPACDWLASMLEECRPLVVAELGAGASSLLHLAYASYFEVGFYVYDHDREWFDIVLAFLAEHFPKTDAEGGFLMDPHACFRYTSLDELKAKPISWALIDHGPTMDVRTRDAEWLAETDAVLVLDDWHGKYRTETRNALYRAGRSTCATMEVPDCSRPLGLSLG